MEDSSINFNKEIAEAKEEMASWSPERRAGVQLEGRSLATESSNQQFPPKEDGSDSTIPYGEH